MIDTSATNLHAVTLSSATVNTIVEALTLLAEQQREEGETPELNELIDSFDALIKPDFAED